MSSSPTILLIEDNSSDVELAMMSLSEEGYFNRTRIINNGEAALDFLMPSTELEKFNNTKELKLILLDIMLPKLNGFEILQRIDKTFYTQKIPVVIFSSSEIEKDVYAAYNLGVNGYLVKPIDFNQHQNIIKSAINFWVNENKGPQ